LFAEAQRGAAQRIAARAFCRPRELGFDRVGRCQIESRLARDNGTDTIVFVAYAFVSSSARAMSTTIK